MPFCNYCGHEVRDNDMFCVACGRKVASTNTERLQETGKIIYTKKTEI